jgi:hypothetical protein
MRRKDRTRFRGHHFLLIGWDVEDHVRVGSASQVGECFINGGHVDGIERLDFEGDDLHVFAGQVPIGPHGSADQIRPSHPRPACAGGGYFCGSQVSYLSLVVNGSCVTML